MYILDHVLPQCVEGCASVFIYRHIKRERERQEMKALNVRLVERY